MALKALKERQMSYPRKEYKPEPKQDTMTSEMIEVPEESISNVIKPSLVDKILYFFQGHYRMFITKQYKKFSNDGLALRILEFKNCLGNHPVCNCPMAEVLLSNKPYEKCKQ
jgi:hypothetical protein